MQCAVCNRRPPQHGQLCPRCYNALHKYLTELPDLYHQLQNLDTTLQPPTTDRITGTPNPHTPKPTDHTDLTYPTHTPNPTGHAPHTDQIGHHPAQTTLDRWARHWQNQRNDHPPQPTITDLTQWLLNRLPWATTHTDIHQFHEDIHNLRNVIRANLGLTNHPDYKHGIPCKNCELLTLIHHNGSNWIECTNCPALLTTTEYQEWTEHLATHYRPRRRRTA